MSDFKRMKEVISSTANGTIESLKPTNIMYGKVLSTSPLEVNVEQRMVLKKQFLIIPNHLSKHVGEIEYDDYFRTSGGSLTSKKRTAKITYDNSLKVNDKVILIREQGGQKFLIIDKVVKK